MGFQALNFHIKKVGEIGFDEEAKNTSKNLHSVKRYVVFEITIWWSCDISLVANFIAIYDLTDWNNLASEMTF